jgi:hypothetical protein
MMNKLRATLLLALTGVFLATNGCKKDQENPIQDLGSSITAFTNQTGEPNETANGLQAQVVDNNNGNTVDFYGDFNALGEPDVLNSIRVTRPNSDTVVNYIINPVTKNFERATFEVNGQVLDLIVKFDFPQGDTTMILSHYNYNWVTGVSELYYAGEYYLSNGMVGENPVFVRQLRLSDVSSDWIVAGIGLGVGITIAELAVATSVIAGVSLVGAAVGSVAVAVAAVSSTVIITAVVVGAALVTISGANASDVLPQNTPTPVGTPVSSPNQPLPDPLPENPCLTNRVEVTVGVDPGNTLVAIAQGGTYGPYDFYWSDGSTATANTYHSIQPSEPGTYSVVVTDENNCAAAASATIEDSGTELSTIDKLIQWGPWRGQDNEIINNGEIVPGFTTLSFSMSGVVVAHYSYTDIVNDQYELVDSYDFCLEQGSNEVTLLLTDSPCLTPPEQPLYEPEPLYVLSLSEQGLVLDADGEVLTCVPF